MSRWNSATEQWETVFENQPELDFPIITIASLEDAIWTISDGMGGFGWLGKYNRTSWGLANGPGSGQYPFNHCLAASSDDLFISGRYNDEAMDQDTFLMYIGKYTQDQDGYGWDVWPVDAPLVLIAEGVTIDHNGDIWMGDHDSVAVSGFDGDQWTNIYELAGASDDSTGLWTHNGAVLAMATGATGDIWFAQYGWAGTGNGKVRFDPDADDGQPGDYWYTNNNIVDLPGRGNAVIAIATHPDGPVIFMHDSNRDNGLVEVLIDPEHYRNPSSWIYPADYIGSTLGIDSVWAAVAARRDVIWFAVENLGLVRWDINGLAAGPDEPITWSDPSDDDWQNVLDNLSGSIFYGLFLIRLNTKVY